MGLAKLKEWDQALPLSVRVVVRFFAALTGVTLTLIAIIKGMPEAWAILDLPKIATHRHVEEKVTTAIKSQQQPITDLAAKVQTLQTQNVSGRIETKLGRRDFLAAKRFDRDLYLRMNQNIDIRYRAELEQEIRDTDAEINNLDVEIRLLRDSRRTGGN
jgi:hypothetical protein